MKEETEITLETLAQMVARGFQSVDARFDAVDQRFDAVDARFEVMQEEFDELKVMVKRIDTRTQNQIDAVFSDVHVLEQRVEVLEKEKA